MACSILAMEYVEGETLRALIQRGGPLAIPRAAEITRQIADALSAAHHLGIVHRDLKPDNILLTRRLDGADWVKVVDFGIAKTVQGSGGESTGGQTVTTAGVSLGTPEYMSPEQLAGERLDARTDLYSLGLVLFNMLTANLPYPRVTSKETFVRRLTSKPQTLAEVVPGSAWPAAAAVRARSCTRARACGPIRHRGRLRPRGDARCQRGHARHGHDGGLSADVGADGADRNASSAATVDATDVVVDTAPLADDCGRPLGAGCRRCWGVRRHARATRDSADS